jgi:hypothetical protein
MGQTLDLGSRLRQYNDQKVLLEKQLKSERGRGQNPYSGVAQR